VDAACASMALDHCFDGWDGVARLRDPVLAIKLSANLSRLVVFTRPGSDSLAVEPVSHVHDAVALVAAGAEPAPLGLVTLAPGESMSARMTLEVQT